MKKNKFTAEYEIKASARMLFPYLSSAAGLQQWFAAKVNLLSNQMIDFVWDGDSHLAKISSMRLNKHVRFDFNPEPNETEHNVLEFKIESSELTNATFLKIMDISDTQDIKELQSMWDALIEDLKEVVGG